MELSEFFAVHMAAGCDLQQIRDCVERVTGETLKESFDESEGRHFETIFNKQYFTVIKEFVSLTFDDEAGIPFSRLPVMVSFEPYGTPPGAEERQELCREIALRVAKAIFEELHYDCVVSKSMQERLATFKSPENDWIGG